MSVLNLVFQFNQLKNNQKNLLRWLVIMISKTLMGRQRISKCRRQSTEERIIPQSAEKVGKSQPITVIKLGRTSLQIGLAELCRNIHA
jgi:hypothetical protein